jgi:phosphoenolpyruvate synthase/pyruvate phosphate dikinase
LEYSIVTFSDFELASGLWRVIVVHSTGLENEKKKILERKIASQHEKITKAAIKLTSKVFKYQETAQTVQDTFIKAHLQKEMFFDYN